MRKTLAMLALVTTLAGCGTAPHATSVPTAGVAAASRFNHLANVVVTPLEHGYRLTADVPLGGDLRLEYTTSGNAYKMRVETLTSVQVGARSLFPVNDYFELRHLAAGLALEARELGSRPGGMHVAALATYFAHLSDDGYPDARGMIGIFNDLDADGDDRLNPAEFQRIGVAALDLPFGSFPAGTTVAQALAQGFARRDADRNGYLSFHEANQPLFDAEFRLHQLSTPGLLYAPVGITTFADLDGDDALSAREWADLGFLVGRLVPAAAPGPDLAERTFKQLDANGDGRLQRPELKPLFKG